MRLLLDRPIADRFMAVRPLKEGPDVLTYQARDLRDGSDVVVKAASARLLSPSARLRLEHESQVLQRLRNPHLPAWLDAGRDEDLVYLVASYVPGTTLQRRLSRAPLSPRETLAVAEGLLEALEEAHEHGLLHRDVKPANVILDEGRVTLVGFGMAAPLPGRPSAPYVAPEQAGLLHTDVGERADLYALGAVLYECLAAEPAFGGESLGEVLRRHLGERPPPLRTQGLPVPRALDDLIARLMRKDPRDRYQSAASALQDVRALRRALEAGDPDPTLVLGQHDPRHRLTEPSFVGRHRELEALDRALAGPGGLVLLEADSGGGKSWLLQEVSVRAAARGILVLRARARTGSPPRPLQLLDDALAGLPSDPDLLERLRRSAGDGWTTACAALPSLASGPVEDPGPEALAQVRLQEALHALLGALGTPERHAVLLLDDCQWADETSLRLALGWPTGNDVLVVLSFRSEDVPAGHPLRSAAPLLNLRLDPLEDGEVRALAESMAGPLPEEALAALVRLAEGTPFLAAELLRGMVECGALTAPEPGHRGWQVEPALLEDVPSSRRGAVLLAGRLDLLPPDARHLLAAAALLGAEFDLDLAAALADMEGGRAISALDEARRRRIVRAGAGGTRYAFLHDRLREDLLAGIPPERRRDLHLRAAAYLEAAEPRRPFDLAWHYDAAGEPLRGLGSAMEAVSEARARHDLEVAEAMGRVAERGARRLEEGDPRLREVLQASGEVLMLRGRYDEAARRLEEALALAVEPMQQAWLEGRLGELAFKRGDVETARAALEAALRSLGQPVPRLFAPALAREAGVQALHTLLPRRFCGRRPRDEETLLAARLYSRLAYAYWFRGDPVACFWAHLRNMNLTELFPPGPELAQAWSEHAPGMTMLPWFSRGEDYVRRSLDIRRSLGDRWGEGQSLHFLGIVLYAASRFREAVEVGREAVRILERAGDRWEVNNTLYQVALSLYRLGDLEAAVRTARDLHAAARDIGDHQAMGLAVDAWSRASEGAVPGGVVRATLDAVREDALTTVLVLQAEALRLLNRGRPEEAARVLEEAGDRVRRRGMRQEYVASLDGWCATAWRRAAEETPALAPARRRAFLRRAARACRRALRWSRLWRNNLPHALREAGMLQALRGRANEAGDLLEQSLAEADRQGQEYEAARTRLERARLAEALGRGSAEEARADLESRLAAVRPAASPAPPVTLSLLDRFHAIVDAGRQVVSALSEEAVLEAARQAARTLLRAPICEVLRPDSPEPLVRRCLEEGRAVRQQEEDGAGSAVCVPLRAGGRARAVLCARHPEVEGLFGLEELRLADYVAALAGTALENAEGLERVQGRSRSLEQRVVESSARLEASERRFRDLVEGLDAVVWEADRHRRCFTFVSPRGPELFGHPPQAWLEPGFWLEVLVHPEDREQVTAPLPDHRLEYRAVTADGRVLWVHETTRLVDDPYAGEPRLRGVLVDVTDRIEAEEALRQRDAQLRQAQKLEAVGRLAGGVAHDFNNLLTAIDGFCELALDACGPGESPRMELEEIQAAAGRAAALTRKLLSFSRRQIVAPRRLDLNEVLTGMERMLLRLIGEDVQLRTVPHEAPLPVMADPVELEQVVLNLVLNARDAMPRGGCVTLECLEEGDEAVLRVSDTGVGMDEEVRSHIFEPFFTTREAGGGTGLGLATVYGVVRRCGGHCRVDSAPGRGTVFEVCLPKAGEAPSPSDEASREPARGGRETVLVVEDEGTVRRLCRQVLTGLGYTVLEADSGVAAAEICRHHPGPIHLLLTDVVMPGLSGPDLARQARDLRPEMRVLYMSGYTDDHVFRHGVETSSVDFLQKPFGPADLAARVREALD